MRITLVISSLGGGGAERVLTTLANYWADIGWTVTIVTIADDAVQTEYPLDPRVNVSRLSMHKPSPSLRHAVMNNLDRLRALRRAIRDSEPDGIIAFITTNNVLARIATLGSRTPLIASERVVYRRPDIPMAWRALRPVCYALSTALVLQTPDSVVDVPRLLRPKVRVIPNPVPPGPPRIERPASERKRLVAMGRLSSEKGFDLLLEAFAKLAPMHPDWDLTIWGQGELHDELTRHRDALGLAERVRLPGATRTPREKLAESDLFVLSSRYEGFPNALCEAMATGLPVVSYACRVGPSTIVTNEVDGILVPAEDVDALAAALSRLMSDEALRCRLGAEAVSIVDRFSLPNVASQWEALVQGH